MTSNLARSAEFDSMGIYSLPTNFRNQFKLGYDDGLGVILLHLFSEASLHFFPQVLSCQFCSALFDLLLAFRRDFKFLQKNMCFHTRGLVPRAFFESRLYCHLIYAPTSGLQVRKCLCLRH